LGKPLAELRATLAEYRRVAVQRTAQALEGRLAALPFALRFDEQRPEVWKAALRKKGEWKPDHPFHAWAVLTDPAVKTPEQFAAKRRELVARLKKDAEQAAAASTSRTVFADFRDGYRDWFVTGDAFGERPSTADD